MESVPKFHSHETPRTDAYDEGKVRTVFKVLGENSGIKELGNLGSEVKITGVKPLDTFIVEFEVFSQTRQKGSFSGPFDGALPRLSMDENMGIWDYEYATTNEFQDSTERVLIEGSDSITRCGNCSGQGRINCSPCSATGRVRCSKCAGKGDMRCHTCKGAGNPRCVRCSGTGYDDQNRCHYCNGTGTQTCDSCHGSGIETCKECSGSGEIKCRDCQGRGEITCRTCSGHGQLADYRYLEIEDRNQVFRKRCEPAFVDVALISQTEYLERAGDVVYEAASPQLAMINTTDLPDTMIAEANSHIRASSTSQWGNRLTNRRVRIRKVRTTEVQYSWKNNDLVLYLFNESGTAVAAQTPVSLFQELTALRKKERSLKLAKLILVVSISTVMAVLTVSHIVCWLSGIPLDVEGTMNTVIHQISLTSAGDWNLFKTTWAVVHGLLAIGIGYFAYSINDSTATGVTVGVLWVLVFGLGVPWLIIGLVALFLVSMQDLLVLIVSDVVLGLAMVLVIILLNRRLALASAEVQKQEKIVSV